MAEHSIFDTEITVLYEPEDADAIVDIVFVHGLQGHPYKTWACKKDEKAPELSPRLPNAQPNKQRSKKILRRLIPRHLKESVGTSQSGATLENVSLGKDQRPVEKDNVFHASFSFWPVDLLPTDCPRARILTWGYDTKITKYMTASVNQNGIFSHSKDLLFALQRNRDLNRPLVFVAHSLGGIIVKDMLARSYMSAEKDLLNIVESITAVVFLGTPHRGSKDLASVGEMARKVASAVLMDTNSAMLDALGLKNSELERCQDSFSRLWLSHKFQVKTFQEGFPVTGVKIGLLNEKIVPDFSSLLGDSRERAETLDANHMDMCRFSNASDPNYRKVSGELKIIYRSLEGNNQQTISVNWRSDKYRSESGKRESTSIEKACLQSLFFQGIETRQQTIDMPLEETCLWLLQSPTYRAWRARENLENHHGLLWIKGKPGSGKSTLMKEAFRCVEQQKSEENFFTACFFFNACGGELERSPLGLFRSLLYQLLPQSRDAFRKFLALYRRMDKDQSKCVIWHVGALKSFFQSIFTQPGVRRTIIFIDALDECTGEGMRDLAYFFRNLTTSAHKDGLELDICLSSRQYPTITIRLCPEIIVEDFNGPDMIRYVEQRFAAGDISSDSQWAPLVHEILERSSGVFLWLVLVVNILLKDRDKGKNIKHLENRIRQVPQALEELFAQILEGTNSQESHTTTLFFQWALLARRTLRLREWRHVLAFIKGRAPSSLSEWRGSEDYTENDQQLEWQIRSISRGLVEVKTQQDQGLSVHAHDEWDSIWAGAGSQDADHGENRVVQFIHESVREFFLHHNGFSFLDPNIGPHFIGEGHLSILNTCLDYISIDELDALVQARMNAGSKGSASPPLSSYFMESRPQAEKHRGVHKRPLSVTSFGTSASDYVPSVHSNHSVGSALRAAAAITVTTPGISTKTHDGIEEDTLFALREFLNDPVIAAPPEALEDAVAFASVAQSVAGQSQVLEDFPALLSYASNMIFVHASLAEKERADPIKIIERLLNRGIWKRLLSLQEHISIETTLLYFAAERNLKTWIQCLLDLGEDCNIQGGEYGTPLIAAANGCNREAMILLLDRGGDVSSRNRKRRTPLHHIAATSDTGLLRVFWGYIKSKAATPSLPSFAASVINATDIFGQTPLHLAVWQSDKDMVEELLDCGANVNSRDEFGDTPLHFACERSQPNLDICRVLLNAGVNSFAENRQLKMPIQVATESGFKEAVTLITAYQKAELPSTPILAPKGLLNVKIVEARGLRKCREPYIVAVFQKNELVSKVGYEDGTGESGRESPIAGIPIGRSGSDSGKSPFAMTLRSRQSSNGSVASLGDYRTVKLGAVNKLMTCPKWDIEAVFDVVGSDSLLDISIYDRGTTNQEFIGRVNLEPVLLEVGDTPVRGWYPLKGYSNDENALGEIYVETTFQGTEEKQYGPNDFQILKLIGKGASGQVYQVRKKGTKRIYAMKVLPKKVIVQKEVAHTVGERNILVRIAISDSPFIVGLKFSFQTPTDLYLIADYMSGGELFWHLQKEGRFNEMRAKFYIAEIILALQHLHSHDIIYRDLKPENILLDANGHIAFCDFGLSKVTLIKNATTNTFCGDIEYLAPEILLDEQKYTKVVDFWSLGVLVFEMCCGWSPFYSEDTQQMHKNIAFGKVRFPRDALSTEGRNFVKGLLNRNPEHRLGVARDVEELKDHPFFNDIDWVALTKRQIPPPFKPKITSETDAFNFDSEFTDAFGGSLSLNARAAALVSTPLSPTMQANFKGFTFVDESSIEEHMRDRIKEQYEDMDEGVNHDDNWEEPSDGKQRSWIG